MKMRIASVGVVCLVLLLAAPLWGCTFGAATGRVNNTHFVYPNSNVTPVGMGEAAKSNLCGILIVSWNGFDSDTTNALIDKVAKGAGGDLLINASVTTAMTSYILFNLCKTTVSGTVAKMEVGRQELR